MNSKLFKNSKMKMKIIREIIFLKYIESKINGENYLEYDQKKRIENEIELFKKIQNIYRSFSV